MVMVSLYLWCFQEEQNEKRLKEVCLSDVASNSITIGCVGILICLPYMQHDSKGTRIWYANVRDERTNTTQIYRVEVYCPTFLESSNFEWTNCGVILDNLVGSRDSACCIRTLRGQCSKRTHPCSPLWVHISTRPELLSELYSWCMKLNTILNLQEIPWPPLLWKSNPFRSYRL